MHFFIITKRILRFTVSLPDDWGDGYDNVTICCTCENQLRANERLPYFLSLPIKDKRIVCEPLLSRVDLSPYLIPPVSQVIAGGESGPEARECDFDWILDLRSQCKEKGISFYFKQTGANFLKDGKRYIVERRYQHKQARKANIDIN